MLKGLLPGTFDPPTKGHLQIIFRAASICDRLIIGIGENSSKEEPILTVDERIEVLLNETKSLQNIEVNGYTGLTTDFARSVGAHILIRGLRWNSDFEFEKQMASANRLMGLDTLFLIADPSTGEISSSLIRQLAANRAPLNAYIPEGLEARLHNRLNKRENK